MHDCPLKRELMKVITHYDDIFKHLIKICSKDKRNIGKLHKEIDNLTQIVTYLLF